MFKDLYGNFAGALHVMYLSAYLLAPLFVLELLAPARRLHLWTTSFNLLYAPVFMTLAAVVLGPLSNKLGPYLPHDLISGTSHKWLWWQTALVVIVYVVIYDFFYYWLHRAQHRFSFLWRFHKFHHSDVCISASSSFRHHWMEDSFRYFVINIPLYVLFGNLQDIAPLLGLTMGAFGLFIHTNTRLDLGILTQIIIGPRYHRVHHSVASHQIDKNFATFFPFWDRLFGTQSLPCKGEQPQTGIAAQKYPNNIWQLLPLPARNS